MKHTKKALNLIRGMAAKMSKKYDDVVLPDINTILEPLDQAIKDAEEATRDIKFINEHINKNQIYIQQLEEDLQWNKEYAEVLFNRVAELTNLVQELPNILGSHIRDEYIQEWVVKVERSTNEFIRKYDDLIGGGAGETLH